MSHGFNSPTKLVHIVREHFPWNKVVYYKININDFQYLKKEKEKKDQDSFWNIINDFKYIQKLLFCVFYFV